MTTRDEAVALIRRLQRCFNTRQFDRAAELYAPGFFDNHPLGAELAKSAWHKLVDRYPEVRVVAEDILLDGDKVAVRSAVEGSGTSAGDDAPMLIEVFRIEDGRFAQWWGSTWLPNL